MIDPLPEELRALVTAEQAAPVASEAMRVAVGAKLGATLGIAPVAAAASAKLALTIKVLGVVLAVTAAGTTAAVVSRSPPVTSERAPARGLRVAVSSTPMPPMPVIVAVAGPEPAEPVTIDADEPQPARPRPARARPARASKPVIVAPPAQSSEQVVAEPEPQPVPAPRPRTQSQLLADASRALSSGNAERALALVDEDFAAHRDGALAEEREALRVTALIALGRRAAARAAARRLVAAFPHTMHRALVDQALAPGDPP